MSGRVTRVFLGNYKWFSFSDYTSYGVIEAMAFNDETYWNNVYLEINNQSDAGVVVEYGPFDSYKENHHYAKSYRCWRDDGQIMFNSSFSNFARNSYNVIEFDVCEQIKLEKLIKACWEKKA